MPFLNVNENPKDGEGQEHEEHKEKEIDFDAVAERLAKLDEVPAPPEADEEESEEEAGEELEPDEEESQTDEDEEESETPNPEEEEEEESEEEESEEEETKEVAIPQAYIQVAKRYGWKDEEISGLITSDPEAAIRTFENLYNAGTQLSKHYAKLGRTVKETPAPEKEEPSTFDRAALEEQYGEEAKPLIDLIEKNHKDMVEMRQRIPEIQVPSLETVHDTAVEESAIDQQIRIFFSSDSMKPFNEVYGDLGIGQTLSDLPAGQREHRWAVLKMADAIAGGAQMQGEPMKIEEALEQAHLVVTDKYRESIIVKDLKSKMKKRSKGTTLRPSKGRKKSVGTNKGAAKDPVSKAQQNLDRIFNSK